MIIKFFYMSFFHISDIKTMKLYYIIHDFYNITAIINVYSIYIILNLNLQYSGHFISTKST